MTGIHNLVPARRAFASAFLLLLSACATRGGDAIPASTSLAPPDPVAQLDVTRQYRLGPGDVVTLRVYRAAELSGDYTIDDEGTIDVPLIGRTVAQGSSPTELAEKVRQGLAISYYENPQVNVSIKQAMGRRVTIDGAVRTPGMYPVDNETTLVRALTLAQGTSDYANLRRVVVFRTIDGQRQAAAFDLKAIRNGEAPDPPIYGSDVVIVDGNNLRLAWRDFLSALPLLAIFQPF